MNNKNFAAQKLWNDMQQMKIKLSQLRADTRSMSIRASGLNAQISEFNERLQESNNQHPTPDKPAFKPARGYRCNPADLALHQQAAEYSEAHSVDFRTALKVLAGGL